MVRHPDIPTYADLNIRFEEAMKNNPTLKKQVDLIRHNLSEKFEGLTVTPELKDEIVEQVEKFVDELAHQRPSVKVLGSSVDENNVLTIDLEMPVYMAPFFPQLK